MTGGAPVPYVVGQWVRGRRFYGRDELLAELLQAQPGLRWVAGLRRIGKTSLLRRAEELAAASHQSTLPLFWDLQGADTANELGRSLEDAFLDANRQLSAVAFEPAPAAGADVADELSRLMCAARRQRHRLLLLIDEAEELIGLADEDPGLVRRMFELLTSCQDMSVVMTASPRLVRLERLEAAPAALADALRNPRLIGPLTDGDARALVRQSQLPADHRPQLDEPTVAEIVARSGGHPYLLQMLAKRGLEVGNVTLAADQLASEPAVRHFLEIDLELIPETERVLLLQVIRGAIPCPADSTGVDRLTGLGLLRVAPDGRHEAGNSFIARMSSREVQIDP